MALSKEVNIAIGVTFVISLLLGMVMLWIILNYVPSAASTLLTGYNGSSNNGGPTQIGTVGAAALSGWNKAMVKAGSSAVFLTSPMRPGCSSAAIGVSLNAVPVVPGTIFIGITNGKPTASARALPYAGLVWDLQAQTLTHFGTSTAPPPGPPPSFQGVNLAIVQIAIDSAGNLIVDGTNLGSIGPAPQGAYLVVTSSLPKGTAARVQFSNVQ
jgi:hypothetical protein